MSITANNSDNCNRNNMHPMQMPQNRIWPTANNNNFEPAIMLKMLHLLSNTCLFCTLLVLYDFDYDELHKNVKCLTAVLMLKHIETITTTTTMLQQQQEHNQLQINRRGNRIFIYQQMNIQRKEKEHTFISIHPVKRCKISNINALCCTC